MVTFSVLHKGVDAVWLMANAWVRHGLTPDLPAVDAYLADFLPEGPVGRP